MFGFLTQVLLNFRDGELSRTHIKDRSFKKEGPIMRSSDATYHEDFHTLKGIMETIGCSEQFIRDIQKCGLILPEIVRFGSEEIEIYTSFDRNIGRRIKEALEQRCGFSEAIISAQAHIVEVYCEAHGRTSSGTKDSPNGTECLSVQRVKKSFILDELLAALDINEESFQTIRQHIKFEPMRLLIPGRTIEYYFEEDYLRLRYVLTLVEEYPLEEAAQ